jgi:hypothetical protein
MNTEVIKRRWDRLLEAMTDAARTLAVPLMGIPVGVAGGMIVRPESYSPLEMRVTAIIYLTILATMMTVATVKHWRHPDTRRPHRALALAQETLAKAADVYEGAVAIHETTAKLLRATRYHPDTADE